jgi:hypothetical protein
LASNLVPATDQEIAAAATRRVTTGALRCQHFLSRMPLPIRNRAGRLVMREPIPGGAADPLACLIASPHSNANTIGFVCQLCVFRRSACRRLLDLGGRGLRLLIDNQLCQLSQRPIGRYLFVQGLLKKRPSPAETHRFSPGAERAVTGNLIVLDRLRRR